MLEASLEFPQTPPRCYSRGAVCVDREKVSAMRESA